MPSLLAATHPAVITLTGILAGGPGHVAQRSVSRRLDELWIAYHQAVTPAYTRAVPPLGGLGLIATVAALAASWWSPRDRRVIGVAVACLIIGLVVTVVAHFPINAEIATWQQAAPPGDWQQLRDQWLAAHAVRTVLAVAGFTLLVAGYRRRQTEPA